MTTLGNRTARADRVTLRRTTVWLVAVGAVASSAVPGSSAAQPCGGYDQTPLPVDTLDRLIAGLSEADAAGAEATAAPSARIVAYHRIVELAQAVDGAYSICDIPTDDDEARFHDATGRLLAKWNEWRDAAWKACAGVVAETHAAGEEARTCVREGAKPVRALAPEPPAAWLEAGADEGARLFDERRAALGEDDTAGRTELAAICLAAGDWSGALALAAPLSGTYEGDLLRGAALAGKGEGGNAACVYRGLVRRDPGRPEAHFNLALLAAAQWFWPRNGPDGLRAPFLHALAYLCLTDAADDPELADDATRFAQRLEEARTGRSAWIYRSDDEPPPLPLPVAELGPESQGFGADYPYAHTCDEVLREAAPGLSSTTTP